MRTFTRRSRWTRFRGAPRSALAPATRSSRASSPPADRDALLRVALDGDRRRHADEPLLPRGPRPPPRPSAAPPASSRAPARTSSATRTSSGWSVTSPGGYRGGPSGRRSTRRRSSTSSPRPDPAEIGTVVERAQVGGGLELRHLTTVAEQVELVDRADRWDAAPPHVAVEHVGVAPPDAGVRVDHLHDGVHADGGPPTSAFSREPRSVRGLWNPGVSVKTIWCSSVVRIARMSRRVVCGLSETIATFWPTSAFTSVDLPTFGRPRTATTRRAERHRPEQRRSRTPRAAAPGELHSARRPPSTSETTSISGPNSCST